MNQIKILRLDQINIDGGTQFREHIDSQVVNDYAEKLIDGTQFPALLVVSDGTNNWLVDGYHRYHANKKVGFKDVQVEVVQGTKLDAQVLAMGVNSNHGLQRDGVTKRKVVEVALKHPQTKDKSDREIAKLCKVSVSFVGAVRRPEVKEKQQKNRDASSKNKLEKQALEKRTFDAPESVVGLHSEEPKVVLTQYYGPDEAELKANELAEQADREMLHKMLEADDALATAYEEIKRLQHLNAQMEVRIAALMMEKNEAIKDAKRAQRQLDAIRRQS